MRQIVRDMKQLTVLSPEELYSQAKELRAPYELVRIVAEAGKLPVPNFSAGGIATPADAALVRQLGAEAVFVGSGIFMGNRSSCVHCEDGKHLYDETCAFAPPVEAEKRARAIVRATTHYDDPKVLLEVSQDLVGAMKGLAVAAMSEADMLQTRGW
jgi:pyridoxal 5'-phosphate synthase pdxS subunit